MNLHISSNYNVTAPYTLYKPLLENQSIVREETISLQENISENTDNNINKSVSEDENLVIDHADIELQKKELHQLVIKKYDQKPENWLITKIAETETKLMKYNNNVNKTRETQKKQLKAQEIITSNNSNEFTLHNTVEKKLQKWTARDHGAVGWSLTVLSLGAWKAICKCKISALTDRINELNNSLKPIKNSLAKLDTALEQSSQDLANLRLMLKTIINHKNHFLFLQDYITSKGACMDERISYIISMRNSTYHKDLISLLVQDLYGLRDLLYSPMEDCSEYKRWNNYVRNLSAIL